MFSPGIERALRTALEAHSGQLRKGSQRVPYVSHPLHVALILARWGQAEAVIQAGLLHDVVEDCEDWTPERLAAEFGDEVAGLVDDLTEDKSRSWAERKQAAIDHVPHMGPAAAVIKAADKLHNLEALLAELHGAQNPEDVWQRFRGGREGTLAMAKGLLEALELRLEPRMSAPIRTAFEAIQGH